MSPTHPVTRLAAAAATLAVLVGCSSSHDKEPNRPGAEAVTRPGPGEGPDLPPPAGTAAPSSAAPGVGSPADWPTEPVAAAEAPTVRSQVIKAGYTGESYLNHVATTWGITMKARENVDFPGRPTVWHASGVKQDGNTAMWIAAAWTIDGDLTTWSCHVTATAAKQADFLHDCAGLDHPGAEPESTKTWLDAMKPRVDTAFAAGRAPVDSPLHRSGPVASMLQKGPDGTYGGDYYELRTFGVGPG
ncbi:hypothetical protein [Kitasatospora sp. NBC_01300]|uniref:hypothetical protein n=1 Tax=Kitasatospora sp. NBC_01300 TaxID=2903574 RepID=UPI002F90BBF8|nr:hypothetical protein OG556_39345 [Kitasatospora sp. NBC_01300]